MINQPDSIESVRITSNLNGPRLLVTGGVHGDEFEPMVAIRRLIRMFNNTPSGPSLKHGTLTLVPVVNRDAFERGNRSATDELDLARCCPGRVDGTITERVAVRLSELIQAADFYIDLHTGGTEFSVLPLTGYCLHDKSEVLEWQRRMARAFNLPVIWGTSPAHEGRSLSVARDASVPAIYAEYLGGARCESDGVNAYVSGCLNVMGLLGMISRTQPDSRVEHFVEDYRDGSGHMQVCNPSPAAGYFEAAVQLGDRIQQNDLLGTVCDNLGGTQHEVRAQHDGIVLVLRTFPRVESGQSLGVIIELDQH